MFSPPMPSQREAFPFNTLPVKTSTLNPITSSVRSTFTRPRDGGRSFSRTVTETVVGREAIPAHSVWSPEGDRLHKVGVVVTQASPPVVTAPEVVQPPAVFDVHDEDVATAELDREAV